MSTDRIQEVALSQDDLTQIVGLASRSEGAGRGLFGNLFKKIKEAVKKAVSIVVGAIKKVVHVIVETAEEIIDFVVDTAEKVVAFVEGVVEKVVDAIKKFVEFLQFLFDWDDILATQRYLVRVINSGFDFATQAAAAAKPRVSAFVDDLQDSVEDGMNSLVTALGGKPSAVKEGGVELPEAFEWLLSKLLGGSKPEDDNISPNSGTNASGDSALGNFLTHFFEAFEDAIGAGLRVSEGLIESIKALLANPRQPELALIALIEAFRDAIIQSLEAVENVALGLLDVIEEGVKLLKNLLNAEIEIPFISNLFERIGAGKLTILNLSSLLLAIPVTVMSKLATGTNLFANLALPFDRSTRAQARLAAAPLTGDEAPAPSKTELRLDLAWTIIGTCADGVGHLVNSLLDVRNKPKPGAKLSFSFPKMEKSWTSGRLEFVSWLCSFVSWSVSYPAQFEPANKEERRELILWSVRGGALAVDGLTLVGSSKRMRRSNGTTVVLWFLYSLVDMVLFSLYLAAVEEDNDRIRRSDISSEVFSWLPSFTCIYRAITLPEPAASIAHFGHSLGVNLLAFGVSVSTGGLVIDELVKALRKAREDAHVVAALAAG